MNTRIRYVKDPECHRLYSKQYFTIGEMSCRIFLFEDAYQFAIIDSNGITIKTGGNTHNKAVLRIQAKRALEELGYVFEEEKRNHENQID